MATDGTFTQDFEVTTPLGKIGDFVWYDTNNNGVQDGGELGIAGVTVRLLNAAGTIVLMTDITDANGAYLFYPLYGGSYIVEVVAPASHIFSPPDQGGDTTDSDVSQVTGRTPVFLLDTCADLDIDAGLWNTTAAVVSSFQAYGEKKTKQVVLTWQTESESGTAGFYVERLDTLGTNQWVRVNDQLIPGMLESPSGGSYSVTDPVTPIGKEATYRLVEVETSGDFRYYGPYTVKATKPLPSADQAAKIASGEKALRTPKTAKPSVTQALPAPAMTVIMEATAAAPDRLRIEVVKPGLYAIAAADLASLGLSAEQAGTLIKDAGVSLTSRGETVGYTTAADGSALYFYGQGIDSNYAVANVYWLEVGSGSTMAPAKKLTPRTTVTSFVDKVHVEENTFAYPVLFDDPQVDFWMWDYLVAGDASLGTKTFAFSAPNALSGVKLEVQLQGITSVDQNNEHHAQIRLNGKTVGETRWDGAATNKATFTIPAGALKAGANQLQVVALLDSGIPYSLVALESFDVTYNRATKAVADQLILRTAATNAIRVDGLSSKTPLVLDLANPALPQLVAVVKASSSSTTSVTFNAAPGRDYLVAAPAGALRPQTITATVAAGLGGLSVDYLVVTHASLAEAAQTLADYRQNQGLSTAVVTTAQIYDEFNYGVADPGAVQAFIAAAGPRYVALLGEGSYDYKNYLGSNDSLVPTLMVPTDYGLAPSDVALADENSDGVPEEAIGRIPVLTAAEVQSAVDKIVAYEASGANSAALLAADDSDAGGTFAADSDAIGSLVPFQLQKAYLGPQSFAEVRSALLSSFSNGTSWINYVGHAGAMRLEDGGLLTTDDVASLGGGAHLPIVTALTCVVGNYGFPGGIAGLSEALVKQAGAGAIGVWSPTAQELNGLSVELGARFAQQLSDGGALGDVAAGALAAGAGDSIPVSVLYTYNLLGDPALRLQW